MSYHGKLQTLKNGTADKEIQHWAYLELLKEQPAKQLSDKEIVKIFQTEGFWQYSDLVHENDAIDFARAIIKEITK